MRFSIKVAILLAFLDLFLALVSCNSDDLEDIPETCFEDSPLLYWRVNGETQSPGTSIEPNAGINLDFLFAIDKFGSRSINFSNEKYIIVFADFDHLITPRELDELSESEWEKLIQKRGVYPFEFEEGGRQEATLNNIDPQVFIGDSKDEVVGGEVKISIEKTLECKFFILEVTALLTDGTNDYTVEIGLREPYIFP